GSVNLASERTVFVIGWISRILLICTLFLVADPAAAQGVAPKPGGSGANSAAEEFAKEYSAFKETLADLPRKIDEANRLVQGNPDAPSANAQLDALRSI